MRAGISSSSIAIGARELERRRDRVVAALALVDVVVGVDLRPAQARRREVADHLVHVRVGARCPSPSGRRRSGSARRSRPRRRRARRRRWPAALAASSSPRPWFVSAAASFTRASARRKRRGIRWPEIGKLRTARWVEAPYRASAGTSISPMESRSMRVAGVGVVSVLMAPMVVRPALGTGRMARRAGPMARSGARCMRGRAVMLSRERHRRLPHRDGPVRDRGHRGDRAGRRPTPGDHGQRADLGQPGPARSW